MNVQMQVCGLIMTLVILFMYSKQKKLYLNTERFFLAEVYMMLVCITLDILSVIVLVYRTSLPKLLVEAVCKLYLVSLVFIVLCGLFYICVDVYWKKEEYRSVLFQYGAISVVASFLILLLPIQYRVEPGVVYTYGASVYTTYITAITLWTILMYQTYKHRRTINPDRRVAVVLWMGIWFVGAVVQFLFPQILLVGFAGTLGVLILYVKLENPQMNLSRQTGLFNHNAFIEYVRQLFGEEKNFSVLSVTFENSFEKFVRTEDGEKRGWDDLKFLRAIPNASVFRKAEDEIAIIFDTEEEAYEWKEKLEEAFTPQDEGANGGKNRWMLIPDALKVKNPEDLFSLMKYVSRENPENDEDNFVCVEDSVIARMYREKEVEILIDEALEKDWVEVFYQPIYSIKDKRFAAAEALVRIRDGEGNLVFPGDFIPVAEKTGKILKLGERVFEHVCRFIRENHIERYGVQYIEVNLSVVQCADATLSDTYISIMERHGVLPRFINLEITESASLSDKTVLLNNMKNLMNYGVNFSLDDFGTGQSNLNYIVEMPVDIVKFDRDMTNAYFDNRKAKYVMDAAMHMIHGMGLEIVSEGIETEQQYRVMKELGISYIQGYYFSKPLPKDEFLKFLTKAMKAL